MDSDLGDCSLRETVYLRKRYKEAECGTYLSISVRSVMRGKTFLANIFQKVF
jgi:hypothetical protein